MSQFKINSKVIVKATGKEGIIKGRDVIELGDGRVKVEYIVKTGNGFDNWNSYSKNELEKYVNQSEIKSVPTLVVDAPNGYKVTLVAIVRNQSVWKEAFNGDGEYEPYLRKGKDLSIGYAICNPKDTFDHWIGVRIATHRAKKSPFCHIVSDFSGEFNAETIYALMKVKANYIVKNIDNFITVENYFE